MNIEFRKAEISDIEKLTEFRQKLLAEDGAPNKDITENILNYFQSAFKDNSFLAYVAVLNNIIISTCGIAFSKKPPYHSNKSGYIGEICNVYTEKEYRRKGLAKSLLKLTVAEAKNRGVNTLRVSASKMGGYLYKDFGFTKAENFYLLQI